MMAQIKINGEEVGETGLCARIAGYRNMPLVFVSGDDKVCQQTKEEIGDITTFPVKTSISRYCVKNIPYKNLRKGYKGH